MTDQRERAATPEDLTRLYVERANAGDADGMADLYEPDAVVAYPVGSRRSVARGSGRCSRNWSSRCPAARPRHR